MSEPILPPDEKALREKVARAQQAKELLDHPLLVEAFDLVEAEIFSAWRKPNVDHGSLENLRHYGQVVQAVRQHLTNVAASGKFDAKVLQDMIESRERTAQRGSGSRGRRG